MNFEPLPFQLETARTVVDKMNGRAILADEVGLGKTIEAGLIFSEYLARGEVDKSLFLVPASLGFQWTNELVKKFNIKNIFYNRRGRVWDYFDHQIASLDKAKRKNHARELKKIDFDLVVVDEAHRLKNSSTLNWKFVNSLKKKYCLLLTATPIQNNLRELYNLISILVPERFQDYREFKKKYNINKKDVGRAKTLQADLSDIMIRNQHRDTILELSERYIYQIKVDLTPKEEQLYRKVEKFVGSEYKRRKNHGLTILNLLTYQREICSSPYALQQTLAKKNNLNSELKEIYKLTEKIEETSKLNKVKDILTQIEGQAIIFTEYRATQKYLAYHLHNEGYEVLFFNGSLSSSGKEWTRHQFQQEKDILISTEAGSQGLNFQFCSVIINFDLPWNPMKLEQRIGRIHRLGQTKDVNIYNLATKNTIEEKVLNTLFEKIELFKQVIGDMNEVVVQPEKFSSLEKEIFASLTV